jgi:hypothetical protein
MPTPSRPILATAASLTVAVMLAGCTAPAEPVDTALPAPPVAFEHIHALASSDGALMVATHTGIYRLDIGPGPTATAQGPIGGLDFDPMGYTITGETAYASGHPGPTTPADLPGPNLGLIRSDDGGATWSTVSLGGDTDFHSMTVGPALGGGPDTIYGLDSATGMVRRSTDGGLSWLDGPILEARAILADPAAPGFVYATTAAGLAVSTDSGATFTVDPFAPALLLVAAAPFGGLVGVDTTGTLWSRDGSGVWNHGTTVEGTPQAIYQDEMRLYVADDRGIAFTEDLGENWVVPVVTG